MGVAVEDLTAAGLSLGGPPFLVIAACLVCAYVRGLTMAMIEDA